MSFESTLCAASVIRVGDIRKLPTAVQHGSRPITVGETVPDCLFLSPGDFLAQRPHLEHLMAGALVFRTDSRGPAPELQTLLIRRASTDSYPLKWERPAGATSPCDTTVLACAIRELWEETGLHASHVECPVGISDVFEKAVTGWGIEPDVEQAELQIGDGAQTIMLYDQGNRWGVVTVMVDVEEKLSDDGIDGKNIVKLSSQEHEEWVWVTESQVRKGIDKDGRKLEFTSKAVWQTVLEGFRIKREVNAALLS